jgi:hypothetical protein
MLFAAVGDWLQFLVPLVFFIIYAINQLLSGNKNKQQPSAPRIPPRRNPEAERPLRSEPPGAPPNKPARGGQAQLNAEIEEFLKRAEQRRGEGSRREGVAQRPPEPPQRRPSSPEPPQRGQAPLEPASSSDPEPRRDFSSVSTSVEQHLGNRGFSQRAEHLADDIARADENMEEHLKQAFGHRVGTLGASTPGRLASTTDVAATISVDASSTILALADMLTSPQKIRQAIVLREILDRPEHRW